MSTNLPSTEHADARTAGLDRLATLGLIELLVDDQRRAADAVFAESTRLAEVVDEVSARLQHGGRLHYVGAGSSGRLATLDAAEMPPTFGTSPDLVCAHIAGGPDALARCVEGAEDDLEAGAQAMRGHVRAGDAVVGLSASGGAPFVVGALEAARAEGAFGVAIVNVEASLLTRVADVAVILATGSEALAGSTRLKAGTAQKIALNAISTAVMVRLGKVHGNLMVDVVPSNHKLRCRAIRLVCTIAKVPEARGRELLDRANGRVKVAVVMERRGVGAAEAQTLLDGQGGLLRPLL